jgi:hypothetical protein
LPVIGRCANTSTTQLFIYLEGVTRKIGPTPRDFKVGVS